MKLRKYSEKELRDAITNSYSISGTLKLLSVAPCGGNYQVIKKAIAFYNIDTEHFLGQGWNKGNTPTPPKPIDEYLNNRIPISSFKLKKRLIKEHIKLPKCEICNNDTWLNKPIALELHHINGNNKDNRLSNLMLLCPNCHAMTDGYRNRK